MQDVKALASASSADPDEKLIGSALTCTIIKINISATEIILDVITHND